MNETGAKRILLIRLAPDRSVCHRPRRASNILDSGKHAFAIVPQTARASLDLEAPDDGSGKAGGGGVVCSRRPSVNATLRKPALAFCSRYEALAAPKPPRNREGKVAVGERHVHASRAADDFDLCIEVLRERLDENRAQAALRRSGGIRLSDPIVGHGKLPVRSVDLVADDDPAVCSVSGKSVFQSVDHELGDYKTEADGLGGLGRAAVDQNLQRDRSAVTDHRGRKAFA